MNRTLPVIVITALLAACHPASSPDQAQQLNTPQAPSDPLAVVIARHNYGEINYKDVLLGVQGDRTGRRVLDICQQAQRESKLLPDCYREVAADLALGQALREEGFALPDTLREARQRQREDLALSLYVESQRPQGDFAEEEVRARFEAQRERFTSPATATVWNIYRRHEGDAQSGEATTRLLKEIKARFEQGETFSSLAMAYSHSENALRGGAVGQVRQGGRLPERLDQIVFSLQPGQVSDPIRVAGGAILLHVSEINPGFEVGYDRATQAITRELEAERTDAFIASLAAKAEIGDDDVVLDESQLLAAIDNDHQAVILEIEPIALTAEDFLNNFGVQASQADQLDQQMVLDLQSAYRKLVNTSLAHRHVANSNEDAALRARSEADERLAHSLNPLLIDAWYEAEVDTLLENEPSRLQEYFDLHRDFYVTPIRYQLFEVSVPLGPNALNHQSLLSQFGNSPSPVDAGKLQALATEVGGELIEHGWLDFDQISAITPPKARQLLSQTKAGETLPPFQQDQALHLFWLADQDGAEPLDFLTAKDEVKENYLRRYGQALSQQLRDRKLSAIGFAFDADAAASVLATPEF